MKKLVNLLMIGCCLLMSSTLFSFNSNYLYLGNNEVSCETESSCVTVEEDASCGDLAVTSFYVDDQMVGANNVVFVAVRAIDFNVATFAWSMAYNEDILRLDSVINFDPANGRRTIPNFGDGRLDPFENYNTVGFDPLPSTLPPASEYPSGTNKLITMVWSTPNAQPFPKNDDDAIFFMCFTAVGNPGQVSPVVFFDKPTDIDVTDGATTLLDDLTGFTGGSTTISGGTGGGNVDPLELNLVGSTIEEGATKCFPVSVDGFEDIFSFDSEITWNSNTLKYSNVQGFNLANLSAANFTATSGKLALDWQSNGSTPITVNNGSNIFEVCFEAVGSVGASSAVGIGQTSGTSIGSSSGNTSFTSSSRTITVESPPGNCGTIPGLSFYVEDKKAAENVPVYVAVTANQFNVATLAWSMAYDSTIIRLDSVKNRSPFTNARTIPNFGDGSLDPFENYNTVGFNPLPSTLPPASQYPTGTNKLITMVWATPNAQPLMKNDCDTIFFMCFTTIGSIGDKSPIEFFDQPTGVDVTDGVNTLLNDLSSFDGGSVEIADDKAAIQLNLAGGTLAEAEKKCFKVSTNGMADIFSFGSEITWDQNVLKYDRVASFNLTDLDAGDFDTSNTGSGTLTLNWERSGSTPTTVANGTNIFEICFEAVGAGGNSSSISFAEAPGTMVGSTSGATFTGSSSTVTIETPPGACGSIAGLSFYATHEKEKQNSPAYVAVTASQFNVATMAWSMAYDSTIIRLDSVKNRSPFTNARTIPNFGDGAVDPFENYNTVGFNPLPSTLPPTSQYPTGTNKLITMVWATPNAQPLMKNDCDTLFFMCFTTIGDIGEKSPVVFFDQPTGIDVTDGVNTLLDDLSGFEGGSVEIIDDIIVPPPTAPSAPDNVDVTNVDCRSNLTGAIELTYPAGNYTFAWTGGLTGKNITGLAAGDYSLTITDTDNLLTFEDTYTVTEPATSISVTGNVTAQINCGGDTNGAISATASGGTGNYTYNWTGNRTGATISNLGAGTYNVTATDANGCTTTAGPFTLTAPTVLAIPNPSITEINCAGDNNGAISITPAGGTRPYEFNWSGAGVSPTSRTQSGLSAGAFAVTVTDANGCQATGDYTLSDATPITISNPTITHSTTGSNGAIDITVLGGDLNGLSDYIYAWTGASCGSGFNGFSGNQDLTGLCPGVYNLMVTDGKNCRVSTTITVENQVPPALISDVILIESCAGESTGSITGFFTGGVSAVMTIKNLAGVTVGSNIASNQPGGTNYIVCLTDQGVIVDQRTVFLREYAQMVVTGTATDDTDNGNGTITLNVTNTVGALSYNWVPTLPDDRTVTGLSEGTYCVTITDGTTGCSADACFDIENKRPIVIDEPATAILHVACPGGNDGSISLQISQGVPPFTVRGTGADNFTDTNIFDLFYTRSNLRAGTYNITVTDANGSDMTTVTINEPNAFSASAKITPRTDAVDGSIDLTVTGGTQPYTFLWNDPFNQMVEDPTNLQNGPVNCVVTDANGCTFTTPIFNVSYFRFTGETLNDSDCAASANGNISVIVEGGIPPYDYDWTGGGRTFGNTSQITDLEPGTYTVIVTGDLGTSITQTFTISTQSTISATAAVVGDASCFGFNDGSANVTPANGQAPYTYLWDTGDDNRDMQQVTGLGAGTATVIVTDNIGCQTTASVNISQPDQISVSSDVIDNLCFGDSNGEVMLNVTGGTPAISIPRYNVFWDNGNLEGQRLSNLGAGEYTAMIEDRLGCEEEITVTVGGPTEDLVASVVTTDDLDGNCTGVARAEVIGGTAPYFYHWSVEADSIERELTDLCSGDYSLTVTDANGCTAKVVMGTVFNRGIACLTTRAVMTPDGEGRNEEFIIFCIEDYPNNTLEIYNRWGQLVWEQDGYDNTWRGTTQRGNDVPDGAYFYVFRYSQGGSIQQQKGSFTLLRQ